MLTPPFSAEDFFAVFAAYNAEVWPVQIGLLFFAVTAVVMALRGGELADRGVSFTLAFFWFWMAVVYHGSFFVDINPLAPAFGAAFAAQAVVFGWLALRTPPLRFRPRLDRYGVAGGALIVYALALYPLVGLAVGHTYPAQPTFGVPCPTTIFTLGLLLWASTRVPWGVLLVPVAWSLVGASAVRYFGVIEDAVLPVAGLVAGTLVVLRNRGGRTSTPRAAPRDATIAR